MLDISKYAVGRINATPLDINGNVEKILKVSANALNKGYKFIAFPELSLTAYNCGDLFMHPELTKAASQALLKLKYELCEGITIGVGLPLKSDSGDVYDAYIIVKKGTIVSVSVVSTFYNARDSRVRSFYTRQKGDLSFTIGTSKVQVTSEFEIDNDKVGIVFNEGSLASLTEKADVLVFPEACRYELGSETAREDLLVSISADYDCLVLSTNLIGCDGGSDIFDGQALIASKGKLLSRAQYLPFKEYDFLGSGDGIAPVLNDYDTIVRAVSLGLFDWMKKTHAHGFALSLSGGADSGLCATCVCYGQIAALHELGYDEYKKIMNSLKFEVPEFTGDEESFIKEKMMPQVLTTVYQGSAVSGSVTRTAALKLAENLGAKHFEWSIAKLVEDYTSIINSTTPDDPLNWERDDLTLQNIQARSRGPGIWMIANRYNKLLITTCNASEDAVGYCTMDGDTCGGVAPIGDISKSRILKINQHIADNGVEIETDGLKLNAPNMSYISAQAPTAELRPGQTDERDLMPYVILDRIHVLHQDEFLTPSAILDEIAGEFTQFSKDDLKTFVKRYFTRFAQNQWKRERGATTFHIEKTDLNAKNGFVFPLLNDGFRSILQDL
ncbi:MAG: NAD(+) synthase [Succinivibrio sp.]